MAVKAVNNTAGPDGLVPTLLAYRAYLRISNLDFSAPSITDQVAAIRKAMAEMVKLQVTEQVKRTRNKKNGISDSVNQSTAIYRHPLFFTSTIMTTKTEAYLVKN